MIIKPSELRSIRTDNADAIIGLRLGCYDLLHAGHQRGIDFTRARADIVVVGVMPDSYVRRVKGPSRPINPEEARVEAIDQEANGVDFSLVVQPHAVGLAGLFLQLRPNVYVEDAEYGASKIRAGFLRAIGTTYAIDNVSRMGSSSKIIANLGVGEAITQSGLKYLPH